MRPLRTALVACLAVVACADDPSGDGGTTAGSTAADTSTSTSSAATSSSSSSTGPASESSSTGEPFVPIDCTDACVDTESNPGIARCYSCRCKAAFDNWLPTPDEVQCSTATPIVTYHADLSTPDTVLEPAPDDATECANPSLLTGSCLQGSKLGQMQHGDVMLRWICRDPHDDQGELIYADMGLIGQNVRTGVACFWDDIDEVTHENDMPGLDLVDATAEEIDRFLEVFYFVDGGSCSDCHDHDPFIFTPYLQSTSWITVAAGKGPYSLVNLNGTGRSNGANHLVSPEAAACTTCHRLGDRNTCSFVRDSLALDKDPPYEQSVRDAAMPGSPHWRLTYTMPPDSSPVADFATWQTLFGAAADKVLACCSAPSTAGCLWEPVPPQ